MTERTHILVDIETNKVVNSVHWDGIIYHPEHQPNAWQPPENLLAIAYDGPWQVGWIWDGTKAIDPNPPPPAPQPMSTEPIPVTEGMRTL